MKALSAQSRHAYVPSWNTTRRRPVPRALPRRRQPSPTLAQAAASERTLTSLGLVWLAYAGWSGRATGAEPADDGASQPVSGSA